MIIQLTQGFVTHVDASDYCALMHFEWHVKKCGIHHYAEAHVFGENRYVHRFLMGEPLALVDHRDRDGLNNRRRNLRLSKQHQNLSNRGLQSNNSTGFKGIHFHRQSGLWHARVKHKGEYFSMGYHASAEEAARYYNLKAAELHGEFACFNDVEPRFPATPRPIRAGGRNST